jgi:hypothetical protein
MLQSGDKKHCFSKKKKKKLQVGSNVSMRFAHPLLPMEREGDVVVKENKMSILCFCRVCRTCTESGVLVP